MLLLIEDAVFPCSQLELNVDGHAKLKPILKTKQSSQPRATSPTCVSRVTWDEMRTNTHPTKSPTKGSYKGAINESHKNSRSEGSHVRGIPQAYRMKSAETDDRLEFKK